MNATEISNARKEINANSKLLEKTDIAVFYGVTPRTVENWMRRGIIPYLKVGPARQARVFFRMEDVQAKLTQQCGVNLPTH